jgi:quercetin dioxygenase-like cupin family protein
VSHSRRSFELICLVVIALAVSAITLVQAADPHHTMVPADTMQWGPAPPSLPPGAQAAVLLGSPGKEGPFVIRLKFPAGFVVPPHRHSKDEFVTVISGKFAIASGEQLNPGAFHVLAPASFVHLPAGMPHYARADVDTIVQINGVGPFDVTYINPKDDPRKP